MGLRPGDLARTANMNRLNVVSLFSGAGGLDAGFEAAGFCTAVALEQDQDCCATLRANWPCAVIEADVRTVSGTELVDAAGIARSDVDVLIGGPPCQPFSK